MTALAFLLIALFQNQAGTIDGTVKDAATNAPLYGVRITLDGGLTTTTDDVGRFHLSVPAGKYTIQAQRDGYFGPVENGIPADRASRIVTLAAGQRIANADMTLQPGGAITGRLLDAAGRPRSGMPVIALRSGYDHGRRIFAQARMTQTDDRGDFRLYWIPPGEYILSATTQSSFITTTPPRSQRVPVRTFFPGTADISKAIPLTVKSGDEAGGFNFAIETSQTVTVTGRIVNPYAPRPPEPVPGQPSFIAPPRIALAMRDGMINEEISSFGNNATAAESRDGIFRLSGVVPGPYDLFVIASDNSSTFRTVGGAKVPVDVGNLDVTGILVTVRPPVTLKGRVTIDGSGPRIDLPPVAVRMLGNVSGNMRSSTPPKTSISPNGEFTIANLLPATYAIDITLPDGLFLADIRLGDRSIKREPGILINGETPELLQIILGRNGGSIRGRLNKVYSDATVVLVPEPTLRANGLLYRMTRPAGDATFEIKDIAPGNYKLFAWDGVLARAWMNAEFLKRYEERGLPIKVDQNEISGVELGVQ